MPRKKRKTKNRKRTDHVYLVPPPLATVLILAAVLSLSYLWLCGRCEDLGKRIKSLERECAKVRKVRVNEEFKWYNMTSLPSMEKALQRHGLQMNFPPQGRVVQLPRSSSRERPIDPELYRRQMDEEIRIAMND